MDILKRSYGNCIKDKAQFEDNTNQQTCVTLLIQWTYNLRFSTQKALVSAHFNFRISKNLISQSHL